MNIISHVLTRYPDHAFLHMLVAVCCCRRYCCGVGCHAYVRAKGPDGETHELKVGNRKRNANDACKHDPRIYLRTGGRFVMLQSGSATCHGYRGLPMPPHCATLQEASRHARQTMCCVW